MSSKPNDWPANRTENVLLVLDVLLEKFKHNPDYLIREQIVSATAIYDLNQFGIAGKFRVTDYTVEMINKVYYNASLMHFYSVKLYLYEYIKEISRAVKMLASSKEEYSSILEPFNNLERPLYFFFNMYRCFNIYKDRNFVDELINDINLLINDCKEHTDYIVRCFICMVNDISHFPSYKNGSIFAFSRDDFKKLMEFIVVLLSKCGISSIGGQLKSVLCIIISNYILKSRNNYNSDIICKYMSTGTAEQTTVNHQIWLRRTEDLNDKREAKVIAGIFSNKKWLKYDWVKNLTLTTTRVYYVSSFCKNVNDSKMKKMYGECIYGYKNDRISELIAPVSYMNFDGEEVPFLSQVIAYDVLYNENAIKEEINYLCDIIDLFKIDDAEKNLFLDELIQYWLFSIKDKKWEYERERRYVIFMYKDYTYLDINAFDDAFLKIKTPLFLYPDFLISNAHSKEEICKRLNDKNATLYGDKSYRYCTDCLSCDFDNLHDDISKCPICGSNNYYKVDE